jgi:hypothetical protein
LIFAQNRDPSSIPILEQQLIAISKRLCRFMMHHFISPKGLYQQKPGHMVDNVVLCDWAGEGQDKLCIVHEHFLHYLKYSRLVYELLLYIYVMVNQMCA